MTDPTVCCVMLTRDRAELAAKAVECFRRQTYENKRLLIYRTCGTLSAALSAENFSLDESEGMIVAVPRSDATIGMLRNDAAGFACEHQAPEIYVHWDDDDWSHPNRIAEQVALLQASGADVVGYSEMLFWRDAISVPEKYREDLGSTWTEEGEAWLYAHQSPKRPYALGTSLCYWRKTWERHHFANETQGVEDHWLREKNVDSVSSVGHPVYRSGNPEPRMIARIHGGNTSNGYNLEEYVARGSQEWKRVPEWDARVKEILEAR
jgi:hypothetical protein